MSKKVRCISPHGGCHDGMRHDGDRVWRLEDGSLPQVDPARLRLPPNPGGYVTDIRIPGTFAAVGAEYEVADDFYADGFHWEEKGGGATKPAAPAIPEPKTATPPPPAAASTTGTGEQG